MLKFTKRFFDIQASKGNEYYENEFINGFIDNSPTNYDADADCETPCPWCFPWHADPDLVLYGENAYDAGVKYAETVFNELKELIEEDEKARGIFRFVDRDDLDAYFNIPENYENFDNTFDFLKHENIKFSIDYDSNGNISEIVVHMPEKFNCFI